MEEGEVYFEMQAGGGARTADTNEIVLNLSARRCMCRQRGQSGANRVGGGEKGSDLQG